MRKRVDTEALGHNPILPRIWIANHGSFWVKPDYYLQNCTRRRCHSSDILIFHKSCSWFILKLGKWYNEHAQFFQELTDDNFSSHIWMKFLHVAISLMARAWTCKKIKPKNLQSVIMSHTTKMFGMHLWHCFCRTIFVVKNQTITRTSTVYFFRTWLLAFSSIVQWQACHAFGQEIVQQWAIMEKQHAALR